MNATHTPICEYCGTLIPFCTCEPPDFYCMDHAMDDACNTEPETTPYDDLFDSIMAEQSSLYYRSIS